MLALASYSSSFSNSLPTRISHFLLKLSLLKSNLWATSIELQEEEEEEEEEEGKGVRMGLLPFISLWFYTHALQ